MFPAKPLIDLTTNGLPAYSINTSDLLIFFGIWIAGWGLFYLGKDSFNDAINYVAFMAIITPTLSIAFSTGIVFWALVLMTLVNIAFWGYLQLKADTTSGTSQ